METFGIYSLKAGVILALFWGIYLLFLQKETFYRFNRGFLLTGLTASIILPLIIIRYTVEVSAPAIPTFPSIPIAEFEIISAGATHNMSFITFFIQALPVVYLTVLGVLLIVRSAGLTRIFKILRRNNRKRTADYLLIESSEFDHAFSFFRFVLIPSNMNGVEKDIILKHENAHIRQKHWIDLSLTNILSLIWWFNPIIRFYEKAIRTNHEYLADQEVLRDCQQENYQQTLLNQWFQTPVFPITNSFSHSNNFKRINMMKKNISSPTKKLFALPAIPAIAIFLMAFSEKEYVVKASPSKNNIDITTTSVDAAEENTPYITVQKDENTSAFYGEKEDDGIVLLSITQNDNKSQEEANYITPMNSDQSGNMTAIELNKQTIDDKPLILVDGKEIENTDNLNNFLPEDIHSISLNKETSVTAQYGERGKSGVILITTIEGGREN